MRPRAVFLAFTLSGAAGLVYEVAWARYLALFVGHSAYAQVLVLSVYLGGMAVGSWAIGDLAGRVRRPLRWYAGAEGALAVMGLAFHPVFLVVTRAAYGALFPALGGVPLAAGVRWGVAGALVLPQAAVLGATFPLMAATLVRDDTARPGGGVATAYLLNTLGGAAGVLAAGFWLIGAFGLPGTLATAALLNACAAGLAWHASGGGAAAGPAPSRSASAPPPLLALLLVVSCGSAAASFAFEVGWIRMLSLVLGGATHAFEIMLSAFILGLAIGAYLIRTRADRAPDPAALLGWIVASAGVAALLTLPVYEASFRAVAYLTVALRGRWHGYEIFNVLRYGLSLGVMLPATILAGAALPLVAGTLLRGGGGDRVIGRVWAVSSAGSVLGAVLAGLVALPALGLKGLLVAGASLDVALGVAVLGRVSALRGRRPLAAVGGAAVGGAVLLAVALGVHLDRALLSSGVFRYGLIPAEGDREVLYYQDGRTATVSAHFSQLDQMLVLSTNGKPDASLGPRWLEPGRDTLEERPIEEGQDFTTQVFAPLVGLAFAPDARTVANVGHGSGMSGASLLTSSSLSRLVTVEIEPAMVEGSFVFLPANTAVFDDPRSTFAFDDARSYFAYRRERFDLIFAEPSNPWVSGTSSLFTREFYRDVSAYLSAGGVLVQWIQLYELTDDLFAGVVAALRESFPFYRGYLVGDRDVVIVAGATPLPAPDWRILESPGVRAITAGMPPFRREHMEALLLFDDSTLRGVLDAGVPSNSDFRPLLDLGAERARFLDDMAEGVYSLGANRFDLRRMLMDERRPPRPFPAVPARGLEPLMNQGRGAWLRDAIEAGGGMAPEQEPEWSEALIELKTFLAAMRTPEAPKSWEAWLESFDRVERQLHWGTAGWASAVFYDHVYRYLAEAGAPPQAKAVVDLLHGGAAYDWPAAAAAADVLVGPAALGERWVRPTLLLDVATVAYLKTGRVADARRTLDRLRDRTGRRPDNLRTRILEAAVAEAGGR